MPKSKLADIISHRDEADYVQNVAVNISHELFKKKMTLKELSSRSGIPESTLRMRLNDPGILRQPEIVVISKVLKVNPYKLVGQRLVYKEVE